MQMCLILQVLKNLQNVLVLVLLTCNNVLWVYKKQKSLELLLKYMYVYLYVSSHMPVCIYVYTHRINMSKQPLRIIFRTKYI